MKKQLIILSILFLLPISLFAQWNSNSGLILFPDYQPCSEWEVVPDDDGGFWFAYKLSNQEENLYVQRYDSTGYTIYEGYGLPLVNRQIFSDTLSILSMDTDGDGGVIISFRNIEQNGDHPYGVYAQRIDRNGQYTWGDEAILTVLDRYSHSSNICMDNNGGVYQKYSSTPGSYHQFGIQHISQGGELSFEIDEVTISEEMSSRLHPSDDSLSFFVLGYDNPFYDSLSCSKVSSSGTIQWRTVIINSFPDFDSYYPINLQQTFNGEIWVSWSNAYQPMITKLNSIGEEVLPPTAMFPDFYSSSGYPPCTSLVCDDNGSVYMGVIEDHDLYINKMTVDGTLPWGDSGIFEDSYGHYPKNLIWDENYERIVFEYKTRLPNEETGQREYSVTLQGLTPDGDFVWSEDGIFVMFTYIPYSDEHAIHRLSDGSYLILVSGNMHEVYCLKAGKVYPDGTVADTRSAVDSNSRTISDWKLLSAYPNPFNSQVVFELRAGNNSTRINIFDITGRKVYSTLLFAGQGRSSWRPDADLSSGIYFITLAESQNIQQVKKIFLLK